MEKVAASRGVGIRYVYNLSAGLIVGYEVSREDFYAGAWTNVASPFEPEAWIIDQYLGFNEFYAGNGGSLHGALSAAVASDDGDSVGAFDVTGSSAARNRVSDKLADSWPGFLAGFASVGRAVRLAGLVTPDVALTITVNFPDGSNVVYKYNWDIKRWEYVPGTARDSNGNNVPESLGDFVNGGVGYGEFDFSRPDLGTRDLENWINRAGALGVRIVGSGVRYGCVTSGGITTCTRTF